MENKTMKTKKEIEQLAESQYGTEIESIRGSNPYDLEKDRKNGFIKGYTQCQEDNSEKKYTIENIQRYHNIRVLEGNRKANEYIESLNKQD
jgi:hypothetical protein